MADKSRNGKYDIVMQAQKIVDNYEKKYFSYTDEKKRPRPHKEAVLVTVMLGAAALFVALVIAGILIF